MKKWYHSKTMWTNGFSLLAMIVQNATGFVAPPEYQVMALGLVNLILRMVTKTGIET